MDIDAEYWKIGPEAERALCNYIGRIVDQNVGQALDSYMDEMQLHLSMQGDKLTAEICYGYGEDAKQFDLIEEFLDRFDDADDIERVLPILKKLVSDLEARNIGG